MRKEFRGHTLAALALVRFTVGFLHQGAHRVARIRDRSSDAAHVQRGIKGTIVYLRADE